MDGGVAFARVANTALISICGELQWSYELLRSLCASTRRDAHYRYLNCLLNCRGKAVLARGRRYRVHVHMYTCTVCAWRSLPRRYRHSVLAMTYVSRPWFESHHQRPDPSGSVLLSYNQYVKLWN
jgi:hypothetical protein